MSGVGATVTQRLVNGDQTAADADDVAFAVLMLDGDGLQDGLPFP